MTLVHAETGEIVSHRSLEENESIIERGFGTFIAVGTALAEIRDARLYLESHSDFDSYCLDRWDFDRKRASALITAAAVSEISDIPIANEAHASALAALKDRPEDLAAALETATAKAEAEGAKLTASRIKNAVDEILDAASAPEDTDARKPSASPSQSSGASPVSSIDPHRDHPSVTGGGESAMAAASSRSRELIAVSKSIEKASAFFALYTPGAIHELNDVETAKSVRLLMERIQPWWVTYKATQPGLVVIQGDKR